MLQKKADNTTPTIQAAILAAYSLNVGNLRDTGHSAEATPPAAIADFETFNPSTLTGLSPTPASTRSPTLSRTDQISPLLP